MTLELKHGKSAAVTNEHIKKFKKSKGSDYSDVKKKRKAETDGKDVHKTFKKSKTSHNTEFKKSHQKNGTFKGKDGVEKPNWNKMKEETKERKKKRKQRKVGGEELYTSFTKAIKLWEELRHSSCTKERRLELCREVTKLFAGNVKVWIKQASGVRMAEHLVAHGDAAVRSTLFDEINNGPLLLETMKDTHSQHFLQKMLRHGSKEQRKAIIDATEGKVVKLTKHSIACQVIELAYSEFASAAQRATMMQEFFGPHFRFFKEENIKCLADVLKKYPNKKEAIMKDLQNGLQAIMHKGIFNNSLILSLLKEYLMFCEPSERQTVVEALEDGLLPVVHTKDGARIAMLCLWHGTAKQRKTILKSFKDHLLQVATWDHSYMVLLAAMDCVDDTKFLGKAVLDGLLKEKEKLLESEIGTRVFRYMVLGRNTTYFHPDLLNVLKMGDDNVYSKKDPETRRKEILAHISESLLDSILRNLEYWSRNQQWTLFLGPAMAALSKAEHKAKAYEALAKHCGEVMPEGVNSLIDLSHSSKMLNFVISKDVDNKKNKMPLFSISLIKHARQNMLKWLDCNRGCFLAVRLIETGVGRVIVAVRELLAGQLKKVEAIKSTVKGAEILLKKLKETDDVVESEEEEEDGDDSKSEDVTMDEVENTADDSAEEEIAGGDDDEEEDGEVDDEEDDEVDDEEDGEVDDEEDGEVDDEEDGEVDEEEEGGDEEESDAGDGDTDSEDADG